MVGNRSRVRGHHSSRIDLEHPQGPDFSINGSEVNWGKWKFRIRMDLRLGIVVSSVSFSDGAHDRSIMYEGHLADIFVPYMDPTPGW
jgi:primary-amine oxidase